MTPDFSDNAEYLGDGVYVDIDGRDIVLSTHNGIATTNRIVLEPEVLGALKKYLEEIKNSN